MWGEYKKALEFYQESLGPRDLAGDQLGMAITLGNMAEISNECGSYRNAVSQQKVLEIHTKLRNLKGQAGDLYSIGKFYQNWGHSGDALDYLKRARSMSTPRTAQRPG